MKARLLLILVAALFLGADRSRRTRDPEPKYADFDSELVIPLPDVQQPADYSCGAAAFMAIASYYGWAGRIGRFQTPPWHVARGNVVHADQGARRETGVCRHAPRGGMTDCQLKQALDAKHPVILSIQAYAAEPSEHDVSAAERTNPKHNRNERLRRGNRLQRRERVLHGPEPDRAGRLRHFGRPGQTLARQRGDGQGAHGLRLPQHRHHPQEASTRPPEPGAKDRLNTPGGGQWQQR